MKMLRKLISIVSAATLLTSSLAMTLPASAATVEETAKVSSEPNIQSNVQDGVILHAFNWSYNSIKNNLPAIAAAGYSTVQTSPVQQPKDYGTSTDVAGQWWKPYQPVSLSFAKSSWFGTKADLTALCTEADKYGIKIICDIVSNHLANNLESDPYSVSDQVKTYEPSIYVAKATSGSAYWHSLQQGASDGNQQSVVQGHIGMPDLNTGNSTVQNLVKNLLNDCIQCGVDGFRFDAAKHIETPSDGSYASNYWSNVLGYARQQYKSKTGGDLYVYGEILNTPGSGRNWSYYTNNLMNITDNATGNSVLGAIKGGNASTAASSSYKTGQAANKVVLWAESHDTYMNPKDSNYSANVANDKIVKAWAMVASRKDATALFFARPGSAKMGEASTDLTYKSVVVSEINKFHNAFVGKNEKLGSSGSYAYVARGNAGIVIVNASGTSGSVNLSGTGLTDGTYTDTVTGNEFKVSGGTVSGTMGSTGVAVVYKASATPTATSSVESGSFYGETMTTTLKFENAVSATYCLDGSSPVSYSNGTTIRIGSDYNYGETINLTLKATDKNGQSKEYVYKYKKEQSQSSGVYVFFDLANSKQTSWKEPFHAYIYDEVTKSKNPTYTAGGWPGLEMQYDSTLGMYYVEVPKTCYATDSSGNSTASDFNLAKSSNTCVIINGELKAGGTSLGQYPGPNSTSTIKLNGKSHIYGASGRTSWTETNLTPTKTDVQATNVTKGTVAATTKAPTTAAPTTAAPTTAAPTTQAPTTTATQPTTPEPVILGYYGDVDGDEDVSTDDVTMIQLYLNRQIVKFNDLQMILADVDGDDDVTIDDVSAIQRYLSNIRRKRATERTGDPYYGNAPQPTTPVQPTSPTQATQPTQAQETTVYVEPTTEHQDPTDPPVPVKPLTKDYYLIGYIDGVDYGDGKDYANFGDYHFDKDTCTVTVDIHETSYVCVKDSDMTWYMTDGGVGIVDSATLFNTSITGENSDKMGVPGGSQAKFTLQENEDGSLDISYEIVGSVEEWSLPDPTEPSSGGSDASFYFTDALGWGDIHLYAWDASGNSLTGKWPGQSGVQGEMNPYNQMVYTINVPAGAAGVIVNGGGSQTANITDFNPGGGGYYVDASKTSTNEFGATVYDPIPWDVQIESQPVPGNRVTLNATGFNKNGAYFYAWTWGSSDGHWVVADADSSDVAHIYFSNLDSKVIFVRMNPRAGSNPSWDYMWNQTGELDTQQGGTFTLTGWGLDGHW